MFAQFHFISEYFSSLTLCTWLTELKFSTIIQSQSYCFQLVITIQSQFMHNIFVFFITYYYFSLAFRFAFAEHTPNFFSYYYPASSSSLLCVFFLIIFPRILTFEFLFCEVFHFVRFFFYSVSRMTLR